MKERVAPSQSTATMATATVATFSDPIWRAREPHRHSEDHQPKPRLPSTMNLPERYYDLGAVVPPDVGHPKCVIIWGGNPEVTNKPRIWRPRNPELGALNGS